MRRKGGSARGAKMERGFEDYKSDKLKRTKELINEWNCERRKYKKWRVITAFVFVVCGFVFIVLAILAAGNYPPPWLILIPLAIAGGLVFVSLSISAIFGLRDRSTDFRNAVHAGDHVKKELQDAQTKQHVDDLMRSLESTRRKVGSLPKGADLRDLSDIFKQIIP
jgi:hypothetical protein